MSSIQSKNSDNNPLALPGEITRTSLVLPSGLEEPEWQDVGDRLIETGSGVMWWIGDWWAFGENKKYGERKAFAKKKEAEGGFTYETCKNAGSVSRAFAERSRRRDLLPWTFHQETTGLSTEELQDEALDWAEERWPNKKTRPTIREFRAYVRKLKARDKYSEGVLPDGKFRILYADPPWEYGNERPLSAGDQNDHYQPMRLEEICDLKDSSGRTVQDLPGPDAVLFMWTTSAMLEDAFKVVAAWGFNYKTTFIWDKVKHNMGHYNSVRHEILLVAGRGESVPENRKLFDSVVTEERSREHSQKPHVFYEIIETLYPHGRRVELFARNKREGWHVFGNQL